jgi:hypothetical protein
MDQTERDGNSLARRVGFEFAEYVKESEAAGLPMSVEDFGIWLQNVEAK